MADFDPNQADDLTKSDISNIAIILSKLATTSKEKRQEGIYFANEIGDVISVDENKNIKYEAKSILIPYVATQLYPEYKQTFNEVMLANKGKALNPSLAKVAELVIDNLEVFKELSELYQKL